MKKTFLLFALSGFLFSCNSNPEDAAQNITTETQINPQSPHQEQAGGDQEVWLESLITATPQEGRELAIKMSRKTIGAIQSDPEVKKRLRPQYAEDPQLLILSAQVVATEFQTIAEANNYWRKK